MISTDNSDVNIAINQFSSVVGIEHIITEEGSLAASLSNSSGASSRVHAIISPGTREELIEIVKIAHKSGVKIYPISCGMNVGYGEIVPPRNDHVILKTDRLNKIAEYDEILGQVFVEPGVSQHQLTQFLKKNNSNYFADVTGASLKSSVLGNTIDGGIGHSPLGYRRQNICEIEVVLANGELMRTREFPALGPDISGLFVQSNYGVVIGIKISLCRIPDDFEMFLVSIDHESDFEELIDSTRLLLQKGTLNSLIHVGNAVRALVSTRTCPDNWKEKVISISDAQSILRNAFVKPGVWNAVGGLYGTTDEISAKKRALRKTYSKHFEIKFFSERKLTKLTKLSDSKIFSYFDTNQSARLSIASLKSVFALMVGSPSDTAFNNASWKAETKGQMGLIWLAPTTKADGESVSNVIKICEPLFHDAGFDMPVTFTFAKPNRVVSAIGIHFNKDVPKHLKCAVTLYELAVRKLSQQGYSMYRLPSNEMQNMDLYDSSIISLLNSLKEVLDEKNIVSSGRYGIGK